VNTSAAAITTFAGAALATLLTIGMPSMSGAATFVYVSDAVDATIDAYVMDAKTGALTSIGKAEAGKTVMRWQWPPTRGFSMQWSARSRCACSLTRSAARAAR
jgi:hypothetical protein